MKRAEEFEIWERSKRKEQKYIRTKNSSTKIYYLPKNHNDSTLTALENTMDDISIQQVPDEFNASFSTHGAESEA